MVMRDVICYTPKQVFPFNMYGSTFYSNNVLKHCNEKCFFPTGGINSYLRDTESIPLTLVNSSGPVLEAILNMEYTEKRKQKNQHTGKINTRDKSNILTPKAEFIRQLRSRAFQWYQMSWVSISSFF
jgi:hypothetical protein